MGSSSCRSHKSNLPLHRLLRSVDGEVKLQLGLRSLPMETMSSAKACQHVLPLTRTDTY